MFHVEPGDVFRMRAYGGGYRVWRVNAVLLGGLHQESVIGLECLDREAPTTGKIFVPLEMLDAANLERIGAGQRLSGNV